MEQIREAIWGKDDGTEEPVVEKAEHPMPHELSNFVFFKCFDACIGDMKDKYLLPTEKNCLTECVKDLGGQPKIFSQAHQIMGFKDLAEEKQKKLDAAHKLMGLEPATAANPNPFVNITPK